MPEAVNDQPLEAQLQHVSAMCDDMGRKLMAKEMENSSLRIRYGEAQQLVNALQTSASQRVTVLEADIKARDERIADLESQLAAASSKPSKKVAAATETAH